MEREGLACLLLAVAVLCPPGSGHIRKFYFVDSPLNWTDAQRHCRDNYTDLASINSTADMDTVLNTTNLPNVAAWIGLYRDCRENWRWSGGEVVTFTHWRSRLPCAVLNAAGFWEERDCSEENYFICERQGGAQQYRLIRENKTFADAQRHCRESCSDLPRVDSVGESEQIRTTAQGHAVWIALLQDSWEWSDGRRSGFRNWSPGEPNGGREAQHAKIYLKDGVHNNNNNNKRGGWNDAGGQHPSPFFCYNATDSSDQFHFIRYKLSWVRAQEYCRHNHTDLVTVFTEEQHRQLLSLTNTGDEGGAWIGLYNNTQSDLGSGGAAGSPYTQTQGRVCVLMDSEGGWEERDCQERNYFMCLNNTGHSNVTLIELNQTWTEAQSLCRQNHTELVSVRNQSGNEAVRRSARGHRVWIGLYNEPWKRAGGQSGSAGGQRCAQVDLQGSPRGRWTETDCSEIRPFFCHWDRRELVLVREEKSWAEALDHCQTHHTGLADILSHQEQSYAAEEAQSAESTLVWLGLRQNRVSGAWFWANEAPLVYQNWGAGGAPGRPAPSPCGALDRDRGGSWTNRSCEEQLSFLCSRDPQRRTGKRTILRLKIAGSRQQIQNATKTKHKLLEQMDDLLAQQGLLGNHTLRWREQPDGRVFYPAEEGGGESETRCLRHDPPAQDRIHCWV
ncbi:macrophage mannose receptor 1-like isoform X1 [Lepisosteus oculatus]|uniref:macrophage mannose receptor 1-like isoform X1 n=1 Tax=Lepisosteus oculatus TaxID=7918 RepID=UPI0035F5252B